MTLRVARIGLPVFTLIYVAEALDYFSDEHLKVTFEDYPVGRDAIQRVIDGKADLATVYVTPFVSQVLHGRNLVAFTTLHESTTNTAIVARRDKGINIGADLKGRRVACTKGTSGEFFLSQFLENNGLHDSDIISLDMPVSSMHDALRNGAVDAACVWHPYLLEIRENFSPRDLAIFYSDVYTEMSLLAGMKGIEQRKGAELSAFLRVLHRAQEHVQANREESERITNQAFGERGIPIGSPIWKSFKPSMKLDHVLLVNMEQEADWMQKREQGTRTDVEFSNYIDPTVLRRIDNKAVTLFTDFTRPNRTR